MSYILDALKKSEQQRGHGQVPGVQTIHSSSLNYHNNRKRLWPTILIIAVLLNLLAISYFIYTNETKQALPVAVIENTGSTEEAAKITTPAPETSSVLAKSNTEEVSAKVEPVIKSERKPEPKPEPKLEPKPTKPITPTKQVEAQKTQPVKATSYADSNDIVDFESLPQSTRSQLPAIIITAHVYSSNPLQRSVVINNNFMEEGEYVLDDLILLEITPDGAIFQYHETRFSYGVVSGWQ